jgi:hypothetical protein
MFTVNDHKADDFRFYFLKTLKTLKSENDYNFLNLNRKRPFRQPDMWTPF